MESKGRSNLTAVKQYLQFGTFPRDCGKIDKRAVRKRSKTFVFMNDQLYYTGGRPKRAGGDEGEEETPENPENDPDYTQVLRKCCTTDDEKQEAVKRCHIGDDGVHYGMEKTTERVSSEYYWVGIINTVRKVLHSCDSCIARGIRCSSSNPLNTLSSSVITISSQENGIKLEREVQEDPDVFFVMQETCSYFWQRVEVQVFGPYTASRKPVYVAVALDCYSQFPEAMVIENISAASLTTFVLNLICRYGVMEKLCMLQNKTTKDVYLYINMQDLEIAGITPLYLSLHANPADERWQRVIEHLDVFVKTFPKLWDCCLEAFMVPLRISLPPQAEYTPAYLTFNREPVLPEKLSHRSESVCNSEMRLSGEQEKQTVEFLMAAYGKHPKSSSTHPSNIDVALNMLPTVKLENLASLSSADVMKLEESTIVPLNFDSHEKLDGRRRQSGHRQAEDKNKSASVEESSNDKFPGNEESIDEYGGTTDDDDEDNNNHDVFNDESKKDETYHPGGKSHGRRKNLSSVITRSSSRKRIPTFKAKAELQKKKERTTSPLSSPSVTEPTQPVKRKRGRPPKVKLEMEPEKKENQNTEQTAKLITTKDSWGSALTSNGLMNSVELLDLDLYYLIIKYYKERNTYPPRVSVDFKRAVRRLAETVVLKDGKLFGNVGKASGRLIIMKEWERFCLLRKAHTKGEEHMGRVRVLKTLLDMNVFWKGMSLDLDAFIHACPECVCHNPLRNKTVVRIPSLSKLVSQKDYDGDPHMSEDEEEESSYEDLIQYLTDNTFPNTATPQQQAQIKQRSESFCIINGSLYYQPSSRPTAKPRHVLFSDRTRQEAIREAHIEDGKHISQQDTQTKLRHHYFWAGMTYDVIRHIMTCCMAGPLSTVPVEHRNAAIQQRVIKFRKYYKEGIPDIVGDALSIGGMFSVSEVKSHNSASVKEGSMEMESIETPEKNDSNQKAVNDICSSKEDQVIRRAMEAIIVKLGGEKTEIRKDTQKVLKARMPALSITKTHGPLTANQLRVRKAKAKHKCDHCGRIIKGDVAFKIHLYKHTGIKPFSCTVCGKSFSNRKSQRIHMRKHTGIRPYLCNQCGREFFRSASLRYHLKAHATGRGTPVECDVCGRSFTTQHRLNRHKEFKHPVQAKVYMCNQCGKHFTAARSLKRHEQTHSGIRKYQCQYCTKAFFRKEYLNSHLTNHSEYDPELDKLKPRKKPGKKTQEHPKEPVNITTVVIPACDTVPSNVIHWTESEQQSVQHRLEGQTVTDLDTYQGQVISIRPSQPTTHILTPTHISHLPSSSASSHTHTIHHTLHHPIAHTARLMNVTGPIGPVSVTVSAAGQPIEVVHTGHGPEILLQHEAVQYEVECLSGETSTLTEADLNAIHLLAQASITGQNMHTM